MLDVLNGRVVYTPPVLSTSRWPKRISNYLRAIADTMSTPQHVARPAGVAAQNDLGTVLSPSQAKTFAFDCSARWWFKYGMKLPDPKGGSLVRGLAVHKTVEAYYRLRKASLGAPVSSEEMAPAYEMAWSRVEADASFGQGEDVAKLKAQGAAMTRKYLDEVAPEVQPSEMEMPVSGQIGGVKVRGIIDLLDTQGRIIDLKTASQKPAKAEPGYLFQLATYHELAGQRSSGQCRLDTVVATKAANWSVSLVTIEHRINGADLALTNKMYPLVQEGMREGLYYPNRTSRLCSRKYCNFADACCREFGGSVE